MAERSPHLLNPLVAFFVMGWKKVFLTVPMHGVDQCNQARLIPPYIEWHGVEQCLSWLMEAPEERDDGNDVLTKYLEKYKHHD